MKRMNSTLSEDCDRYMGEVSMLSMERDELNDKVTEYEEKIKVRQYNVYLLHNAYTVYVTRSEKSRLPRTQ